VAVKWFNPEKGFGFVVPTDGSADAFLHIGTLERSGHAAVAPGATLQVRIGQGQKGPQVTEVIAVDNSTATAAVAPPRRDRDGGWQVSRAPDLASAIEMTGTVKFYSAERGFGFIVNDAGGRDVFVHASALRRSGMSDLFEGQRVTMRVVEGRKGPEAASIGLATV
jgi:CspA family cold shock protein